jgi:hypothetical protein
LGPVTGVGGLWGKPGFTTLSYQAVVKRRRRGGGASANPQGCGRVGARHGDDGNVNGIGMNRRVDAVAAVFSSMDLHPRLTRWC